MSSFIRFSTAIFASSKPQKLVKIPNGRVIPKSTVCNPHLLGLLLTPFIVTQPDGRRIVVRTTRQQIERYWHLIVADEPHLKDSQPGE